MCLGNMIYIYIDFVRHKLRNKFKNEFKSILRVPLEDNRFISKNLEIENNINQLGRSINGLPIQFIFNIDEMGVSEFEDSRKRTVIVPVDYPHSRAPYPISRSEKHATCLSRINLCGLFVHFFKQFKDLLLIQKYIII